MSPEERESIVRRLRSAEVHLGVVIALLEGDKPSEQVLRQIGSVRADLRAAGARLLDNEINHSEEIIQHSPHTEERETELSKLLNLYTLLVSYSDQIEKRING